MDQNPPTPQLPPQGTQPPTPDQSQQPPREDPGKAIGIIGLIVGFVVFPVIGLVLCIVANSQSKKAGFNNTLAKVGIWIHGALTILIAFWFLMLLVFSLSYKW